MVRYMVIQLRTLENENLDLKISDKELQISVLNMIKLLHGDFGAGAIKTCFKVRYCNPTTKIFIFKTRHGPHKFLSSVIPFVNKLQEKQIQLSTIYTGASMFQCYKFIQNYQKNLVRKVTDTISEKTKEKMLNITNVANF
ncbi:ribonuclease P/MRP protein subunit POP5 [Aphis craccivora]|uniref:Ribonuclease P/MRP protein subunit POP5 n=1 Tax=Aphis craccivora TaxID=307492 RepID=A0A6G0Z9A1_APHCR|nr:ribonuclease P/MRP protein subunit POP5 [Aphis craccivora]